MMMGIKLRNILQEHSNLLPTFWKLFVANIFLGEPVTQNVVIGGIISLIAIYIINRK